MRKASTGILYVGLDFAPNAPAPVFHQLKPEYQEIPTLPSEIQQLLAKLADIDVRGLSERLNRLLARVDAGLGQLDIAGINEGVTNLLGAANQLVRTPDLTNSLTSLRLTLDQARGVLKRVDGRVDPLADSVASTLSGAQKTLADLRVCVRNVSDLVGPDSALRPDLAQALEQLGDAGRTVADLAEFLKRDPNALLAGKKRPKEEP
jgi:paraquat-inducible protein B